MDLDERERIAMHGSIIPAETTWTIAFDGKNLGKVLTRTENNEEGGQLESWYNVDAQKVIIQGPVPTIGKRSEEYSGHLGGKVYRPLVANSMPYYKDPDGWKPATLSDDILKKLRQDFRKRYPHAENCINAKSTEAKPWLYRDSDIKVYKSYFAKTGWSIAGLYLTGWRCDAPENSEFVDQWYAISPTHEIKFLKERMTPVDAGDYDNTGKSSWIFSLGDYNRYGYALFYDDFKKSAVSEGSFH
jgi:hypothetical protein